MVKKKKYDPMKEIGKTTGLTTATLLGSGVTSSVASHVHGGDALVASPLRLMGTIPVVGAGGSVIRSLDMLNVKTKKRKKKRR